MAPIAARGHYIVPRYMFDSRRPATYRHSLPTEDHAMDSNHRKPPTNSNRRALLGAGLGAAAAALTLPRGLVGRAFAAEHAGDRNLAGRRHGRLRLHRHRRAAHRDLCGPGRRRAQGLAARHRAHQLRPSADAGNLAAHQEGRARQGSEVRRRRLGRQAQRRGAGRAALHHREQGHPDDRLDLERGRGGAQQARAAREGALRHRHLGLQRHHRQGLRALRLPPVLLRRRPRPPRSARSS